MPGMVYHLLFAKLTAEKLHEDIEDYVIGNILPDFAKNKDSVHHYPNSSNSFFVPDLDAAKRRYSRVSSESLRHGVLAHLYCDKRFTEDFLMNRFEYDPRREIVTLRKDPKRVWTLQKFFSYEGLYHAYSEMNPMIFQKHLPGYDDIEGLNLEWLKGLPHKLPCTGVSTLDDRTTDDWFGYLEGILENPPEYTGELFSIEEMVGFIVQVAEDFASGDYIGLFGTRQTELELKLSGPAVRIGETSLPWETLREGIIETLLKNPCLSIKKQGIVIDFVSSTCEAYQLYREEHISRHRYAIDTPDIINQIAVDGAKVLQDDYDNIAFSVLKQLYDENYSDKLNQIYDTLTSCEEYGYRTDKTWVSPIKELLVALAAASGEVYRLIVSYSNF